MNPCDRRILSIALPSIVSNITVPLLGLVDVSIVGHLGASAYIGAIAIGTMVFNVVYWLFGFLRMGTSGMTSQALGRRDLTLVVSLLVRSVALGMAASFLLLVLQRQVFHVALVLIAPGADVTAMVERYFSICIWGVPAMLGLYGLSGWFIGMQNTRFPMMVSIVQNVVNIAASMLLVFGCGWKIEGVATGTLVAQYCGFFMGLWLLMKYYRRLGAYVCWEGMFCLRELLRFFSVNRDLFLRTLFLVVVNFAFLRMGVSYGADILAANTLLMQFFTLFSYIIDGFAYAGEALCGKYKGADNVAAFRQTVRRLFLWGGLLAVVYTLAYVSGGRWFLSLLTDNPVVVAVAGEYLPWAIAVPVAGMAAFVWDGVFVGTTSTRGMLVASAGAAALFFLCDTVFSPGMGNHALWLSMIVYLAARGVIQTFIYHYGLFDFDGRLSCMISKGL